MALIDLLKSLSQHAPEPDPADLPAFAADISRNDPAVVVQIGALSGIKLEWVVTDALFTTGWALHFDWRERADVIVPAVDRLLAKLGAAVLDPTTQRSIHQTVTNRGRRILKTEIDLVYGPLCEQLESRGLRFLDINRGGDDYAFVIAGEDLYRRWVNTKFSEGLAVEDPGWQFVSELKGTRYRRFADRRRLRRPGEAQR